MKAEGNKGVPEDKETKYIWFLYPDQHEHMPDLDENDELDQQLTAVKVGPRQWRILESPVFSEAVNYGDTVEGDFDEEGYFIIERVVKKSDFRTIRTMVPRKFYFSDFGKAFLERVMDAGGMWEIVFWGILILNFPEGEADELEELFHAACREASSLGKTEQTRPNLLYRQRPGGGTDQTKESN